MFSLWQNWNEDEAKKIAAMNLFLDKPIAQRREEIRALQEEVGACNTAGPMRAENWLRGQFNLICDKGTVGVFFSLSPTTPPRVEYLGFQKTDKNTRMSAPTGPPAGVSCAEQN